MHTADSKGHNSLFTSDLLYSRGPRRRPRSLTNQTKHRSLQNTIFPVWTNNIHNGFSYAPMIRIVENASLWHGINIHRTPFKQAGFLLDPTEDSPRPPAWKLTKGNLSQRPKLVQFFCFNNLLGSGEVDVGGFTPLNFFVVCNMKKTHVILTP